jgi:hypothetical protein
VPLGNPIASTPEHAPPKHAAHYLWAVLIARIYEVFPLLCPMCGGQMRLIAFITEGTQIRRIQWDSSAQYLASCGWVCMQASCAFCRQWVT